MGIVHLGDSLGQPFLQVLEMSSAILQELIKRGAQPRSVPSPDNSCKVDVLIYHARFVFRNLRCGKARWYPKRRAQASVSQQPSEQA